MTLRRAASRLWLAAACLAFGTPLARGAEGDVLQPFQMVRSLQLVQDRIADGDHAALPMQRKLLEMIDARFRDAPPQTFDDPRNFRSLLIYAMSGGNPVTVDVVRSRLSLAPPDQAMLNGIVDYLTGRPKRAANTLSRVDPMVQNDDLGAFIALVRGSLLATDQPVQAIAMFDKARLLGPGTLVEEAALRRSITLATGQHDAARFVQWSHQYVRRFLRSPYASQFADSFVNGVLELAGTIDFAAVDEVIARMAPEQRQVIYLRLARRGAIDGAAAVTAFAAPRAGEATVEESDPRAKLYAALAGVTSENVGDVAQRLGEIDATRLSKRDRELYDAVRRVSTEITAPVEKPTAVEPAKPVETEKPADVAATSEAANAGDEFVPDIEEPAPAADAAKVADAATVATPPAADAELPADEATQAATLTASTARDALKSIDKLLEESPQ